VVSAQFAIGWIGQPAGSRTWVKAALEDRCIGVGRADIDREDLAAAVLDPGDEARAFIILFDPPVPADRLDQIEITMLEGHEPIPPVAGLRRVTEEPLQLFVLGSARSGTSQMSTSLAAELSLPWTGEGHAAARFAKAAALLAGDSGSSSEILQFMARQSLDRPIIEAALRTYYFMHASTSFLDKTPDWEMIQAAPFLSRCFPAAKFIFLRRNGLSNVASRMAKFGGSFLEHCEGWVAAMTAWETIRGELPDYLEIEQETMRREPGSVAEDIAEYLDIPDLVRGLTRSLEDGTAEMTGAGTEVTSLATTGWNAEEIAIFYSICGGTMERWGYALT